MRIHPLMLKLNTDQISSLKKINKRYWALGLATGIVAVGLCAYSANQITFTDEVSDKKEILFTVPPRTPAAKIPAILEKAGVEVNDFYFKLSLRLTGAHKNLRAGIYGVYPNDTVGSITERLSKGEAYMMNWRIADGSTYWEVRKSLNSLANIKHDSGDMTPDELLFAIGAKEGHLEGLFAPDTYNFHANVSDLLILKKAYEQQQAILMDEWNKRYADCAVKTPYEALILASIVEREVGRSQDRPIVAGIFSNRLRIKMPLQTDPSVIYGEGENFGGDIKREHLRRDTPYNTYRFVGLPPTPIGNPTRESIHAVMHPAKTDYLYFINKSNGDLVPSKTLAEHNRAVRRYILNKEN